MDKDKNVAIRKRQQIENASKTMFMWVAIAAVVVGIASVLSVSLYERLVFNQEVIDAKNTTANTLRKNNEVVEELKQNVRILNTNQALIDTPKLNDAQPVSVILDALPSQPNSSALGASLQQKLLQVGGVSIDSLTVDPISGVEDSSEATSGQNGEITFSFVISTDANNASALKQATTNLERSIRAIDLTQVTLERQSNRVTLSATGKAFYQTEKKVELNTKVIKP